VDVTLAVPHVQRPSQRLLDVGAEEHVRAEQDLGVLAMLAEDVRDDLHRVGRGAAEVGLGLDLSRRVDVHDHDRAWVARLPVAQLLRGDRICQRAPGLQVGDQHPFVGAQDRRGLGHEVHAAEHDRVGVGLRRALGETERIAHIVGDLLDLGQLVVVRQDHCVAFPRQGPHLVL
jgi:hypothetical protein